MLVVRNLRSGYGSIAVLKAVSLHVGRGEIVVIIGPNGAGKSTLLMSVTGLVAPFEGEVEFEGRDITAVPAEKRVGLGCVLVPEGRRVFATLSVRENLELGAYHVRRNGLGREVRHDLERIFALFPILRKRERQMGGTLSGGEQQMLAIGRALMARPALLMMDEPSMGLAPVVTASIFKTVLTLREQGLSILLVEQNARRALSVADRGYVIETGQMVLEGTREELLNNNDVQRAYLGKDYSAINE
ncbi:MAG: ABC transporter ATP-binding protein [Spirochaetales bacterium]|nr:ABC transporter ATP-binding protein [Spirochaetales bacterium]